MANVRAFILDPTYRSANPATQLRDLAAKHFSWTFEQVAFEDTQVPNPEPVIKRIQRALDEADVLIGLGNYFLFNWLGDHYGEPYIQTIIDRMRRGMPSLFQLPRFFDGLQTGQITRLTERILRSNDVLSTNNRVYSDSDPYEGHTSPMISWFRKSDGCLLNPELFSDVDSILMASVNLVDYGEHNFPIIEAGPQHGFVDMGDLPSKGVLGKKNAVAIMRRHQEEFSVFLGGTLLNDPVETGGGTLPGITANCDAALKLINSLDNATQGKRYLYDAFSAFYSLESDLGRFINAVLGRVSSDSSIDTYIPDETISKLKSKGGINYSLADYIDLVNIMLHNWEKFADYFSGKSRGNIRKTFLGFNYKYRRYLAHPHKSEQEGFLFDNNDVAQIRNIHALLRDAIRKAIV